jgi:hypothetical protein
MTRRDRATRPPLTPDLPVGDFRDNYWTVAELKDFAKRLDVPATGPKPELTERIERRLLGLPDRPPPPRRTGRRRDSERPLTRDTPVVEYRSDEATRAFFEREIGPHFRFSYHLNQFRKAHDDLTYGDLVGEWVAEHERRKDPEYRAPIAEHGVYNTYVRDFFADERNTGASLRDAVESWNATKDRPGGRRYRRERG